MRCMLYAIWCQFYNLKNVKNIHGGVLLLVKLQVLTVFLTYILIKAKYFIENLNMTVRAVSGWVKILASIWRALSVSKIDMWPIPYIPLIFLKMKTKLENNGNNWLIIALKLRVILQKFDVWLTHSAWEYFEKFALKKKKQKTQL